MKIFQKFSSQNEIFADEVKIALAAEQAEASKGGGSSGGGPGASKDQAPPALDPDFRTFVVSSDLSIVADGEECALSDGDPDLINDLLNASALIFFGKFIVTSAGSLMPA